MDLNWLDDFLALAEHRNFSRAAEARNVTQPAFSRRIQALEAWVGTPLSRRSPQGVILNAAGEYLKGRASDITSELRHMRYGTLKAAKRDRPTFAIAATHALSFTFFPSWIRATAPLEALGTLNLVSDTMAACERILLAGEVDFLICHHHRAVPPRFEPHRYRSILVGVDQLIPLTAPDDQGAARFKLKASSQPIPFLAYSAASGLGRILDAFGFAPGRDLPLETVFTSPLAAALQTMARQEHGVTWLPQSLAADDIAAGRLLGAGDEKVYSLNRNTPVFVLTRQPVTWPRHSGGAVSSSDTLGDV